MIEKNLEVDILLGTLFINQWIHRIFQIGRKVVPWNWRPVQTITTKMAIISKYAEIHMLDGKKR